MFEFNKNKRFIKKYEEVGSSKIFEIWVDTETGVNYLYHWREFKGMTLTPLLDKDGKPIVTAKNNI